MSSDLTRRTLLAVGAAIGGGLGFTSRAAARRTYRISLAAWSLHREIQSGRLRMLDAPRLVREDFDLGALELVNTLLEVPTAGYVERLRSEAERHQVAIPLIMCDDEGEFGHADAAARARAVRDHTKWIWIASDLGCHSIRVNWAGLDHESLGDREAVDAFVARSADAYGELLEVAGRNDVSVLVENHGGASSDPRLLGRLMEAVGSPRFGTLPDFGNFPPEIDKYEAIDLLMPWAKAVSAKCYAFDEEGNETTIDFERMLAICVDEHGYSGWIGIEFEGPAEERQGILAARDLLRRLRG